MTHPEDLLASYVDGSATGDERAAVEAHLPACARCRAEVAQASSARTALRSLPVAEAPAGLAPETASGAPGSGAGGTPAWYRWGGVVAAAAAIVLLLTLVLPRIGGGGSQKAESAAAASGTAVPREAVSPVPIEIQPTDFGGQALSALAKGAAQAAQPPQPVASGTDSGGSIFDGNVGAEGSGRQGSARQAERAQACLTTAFVDVPGRLVRLIAAPFDGTPAYIGLYQQSSVANQPADTVVARAAAAHGCTPLSIAQARFG
jgi:hypothetical protein